MAMDDEAWFAPWREVERDERERGVYPTAPPPDFNTPPRVDPRLMRHMETLFKRSFDSRLSSETRTWSPPPPPRRGREMLTEEQRGIIEELRALLPETRQDTPSSSKKSKARAARLWTKVLEMDLRGEGAGFQTVKELVFNGGGLE